MASCTHLGQIAVDPPQEFAGCEDCLRIGGQWVHLRVCRICGHVGCCDSSPNQHASAHAAATGHRVVQSFEPGEDWFWDYVADGYGSGPALAPPTAHPAAQPVPGPAGRVPAGWTE